MVIRDGKFVRDIDLPRPLWRYERDLERAGVVKWKKIKKGTQVEDFLRAIPEEKREIAEHFVKIWTGEEKVERREDPPLPKTLEEVWKERYPERVKRIRAKRVIMDISTAPIPVKDDENFYNLMVDIDWKRTVQELFGEGAEYHRSLWVVMGWEIHGDDYEEPHKDRTEKLNEAYKNNVYLVVDEESGESVWVKT